MKSLVFRGSVLTDTTAAIWLLSRDFKRSFQIFNWLNVRPHQSDSMTERQWSPVRLSLCSRHHDPLTTLNADLKKSHTAGRHLLELAKVFRLQLKLISSCGHTTNVWEIRGFRSALCEPETRAALLCESRKPFYRKFIPQSTWNGQKFHTAGSHFI